MIGPSSDLALHFLDLGSVYTPDGREHPVTSLSLPFLANLTNPSMSQPSSSNPNDPPSTYPATGQTSQAAFSLPSLSFPSHIGARLVVIVVALIILAIVVARLLK